jgi:TRAP-type C4-dicarboxylate transport system permease small subunit
MRGRRRAGCRELRGASMEKLMLFANKVWKAEAAVAWVFMFVNVLLIVVNIIMRRAFGMPIYGSTEFVRYISLVAASFALAQNEWIDGNITMSLLHEKLPKKIARRLKAITNTVCAIVFVLISYLLFAQFQDKLAKRDISYELGFPIWIPALILAIGFAILTASIIIKTILLWHLEKTGDATIVFRDLVVPKENQTLEA